MNKEDTNHLRSKADGRTDGILKWAGRASKRVLTVAEDFEVVDERLKLEIVDEEVGAILGPAVHHQRRTT